MNYAEMSNAELRERVELLKQLRERELEAAASKPEAAPVDALWYPEMHKGKWVEHSPSNPVDRSRVADVLYATERSTRAFVPGQFFPGQYGTKYDSDDWDSRFNWDNPNSETNIVAVVLKY